ncbi:TcdA/TcdB pore-forming domain-containing protein [Serratia ureilytica]|uniref:TcdA/TcdB pore-forming domain-containing protein n=1 Tax=Serratia ureilytica TaxID=300181 RepID=UPI0032648808
MSFSVNPSLFSQSNIISSEGLVRAGQLPAVGEAKLVKVKSGVYEIEYADSGSNEVSGNSSNNILAYFLGYNGQDQANTVPAYVDIPKHATNERFLFTGTLSGGSVVVTELNDKEYRVYNDGRVNSSLLYDNVVMAVDFKDYQTKNTVEGISSVYMQYIEGKWQLVMQRQEYQYDGSNITLQFRDNESNLLVQDSDSKLAERSKSQFKNHREMVHQDMLRIANEFSISTDDVSDGVYEGGEFSTQHSAISSWIGLRNKVQEAISMETQPLERYRNKLYNEKSDVSDSTEINLINEKIKYINLTLEHYKERYDSVLREVTYVEQGWLWQQIKAKNSTDAVVTVGDALIKAGSMRKRGYSIGERYATAEAYQRSGPRSVEFSEGMQNFNSISIPGFNDGMSLLEMKKLFLDSELTPKQRGALSNRISEVSKAEHIDKVLKQTAVLSEDFQRAGSSFSRLIPQDFYLSLVGDGYGGRCYPLVRAMAVALATGGETSINRLVEKLFFAAASPESGSSSLLKNSLVRLHSSLEAHQASKIFEDKVNLADVVALLKESSKTTTFALNTQNHAMMVGSILRDDGRRYYFYDPNFGIYAFDTSSSFLQAMEKHLIKRGLGVHYNAFGSKSVPTFNLVEIDPDKMAKVPVGNGLDVADLINPDELATVIEQRKQVKQVISAQVKIAEDTQLRTALVTLDTERIGQKFYQAMVDLAQENNLGNRWVPIIGNIKKIAENRYSIPFINQDRLDETRIVTSSDASLFEFRRFIDEKIMTLGKSFNLERGQLHFNPVSSDIAPIDGFNAGFVVQALIKWFADKKRNEVIDGAFSLELDTALKVHTYLNYAQMAHAGINDVVNATKLVQTALRGEAMSIGSSLNQFSASLARTANEGLGLLLGGALVGVDAYELAHAETDTQKAVFGTQLAFDSASLVTGTAGIASGLVGASTASAVLGGSGVILGGLAVGFTALAQAFGAVAEDAKAVGRYFDMLDKAYKGNGYQYDEKNNILVPLAGAVIKSLDLTKGQIGFDSQYIYRTHSGTTGSGKSDYFFWIGDFPRMVNDRTQAIEVRSGIGYPSETHKLDFADNSILILPSTPKSYISYDYMQLPGATTRHDTGFDVIRRLEEDKRFDYDFYIFPGEVTIRSIHQEYIETSVEVILGGNNRKLVLPKLPKEQHGYLRYEIKGGGGEYLIGLNEGASVSLINEVGSEDNAQPGSSRWVIDSSQLDNDAIVFGKDKVIIGGVTIDIASSQLKKLLVVNGKNEIREVDFSNQTTQVIGEDASRWQTGGERIEQHLENLAKKNQLSGQYVVVDNYNHNGHEVGRGFYDVSMRRMLFTNSTIEQTRNAKLGAVVGGYAYFYDGYNMSAWRVDIATGEIDAQFAPWIDKNSGKISRLWQEGNAVYLAYRYSSEFGEAELSYRIQEEGMELVSAVGGYELLRLAASSQLNKGDVKEFLRNFERTSIDSDSTSPVLSERLIHPVISEVIAVSGTDNKGLVHRYWIRTSDGAFIKPNFMSPELLKESGRDWNVPSDLVLAGSIVSNINGRESFFFYSKEYNILFRQVGLEGNDTFTTSHIEIPSLANVLNLNGSLIAVTDDGLVAQLDADGNYSYEGVNEHWLKKHEYWWQDLAGIKNNGAPLAIFGVKGSNGENSLPIWYQNGHVVVASPIITGNSLQFLGVQDEGNSAAIFDAGSGKLYIQPVIDASDFSGLFSSGFLNYNSSNIPMASELLPDLSFKSVQKLNAGLRLITSDGEVLTRSNTGVINLIGVDSDWYQSNSNNLLLSLKKLVNKWGGEGVLTLKNSESLFWFDTDSGQVFSSKGVDNSERLLLIGIDINNQSAYLYDPIEKVLFQSAEDGVKKINKSIDIERINSTLILRGGEAIDNFTLPIIKGVDNLVLHGGENHDVYRFSNDMWQNYRTVVIDNDDSERALDGLILPLASPESILLKRERNDLIFTDVSSGTAIVLRSVFGSEAKSHQHLNIELEGSASKFDLTLLVARMEKHGASSGYLMGLSVIEGKESDSPVLTSNVSMMDTPNVFKLSEAMASFEDMEVAYMNFNKDASAARVEFPVLLTDSNSIVG